MPCPHCNDPACEGPDTERYGVMPALAFAVDADVVKQTIPPPPFAPIPWSEPLWSSIDDECD